MGGGCKTVKTRLMGHPDIRTDFDTLATSELTPRYTDALLMLMCPATQLTISEKALSDDHRLRVTVLAPSFGAALT